ncbi:micronuclear linker histone polyprotein-like [Argopecten irradians]|uniref:micronuclear linker histone polyprotein-like n=1 Tax=Argopecten irradians TaxID=31199 RepID=UPI00370FA9EA
MAAPAVQDTSSSQGLLATYFSDQMHRQQNSPVSVLGNIHQGSDIFLENAGKQCTCNCCIFLVHMFAHDSHNLCPTLLDDFLKNGNKLYKKLSKIHHEDYLMIKELEGILMYNNQYYKMSVIQEWSGLTCSSSNFQLALNTLINEFKYGFLMLSSENAVAYASAIYSSSNNVYIFDPHSRNAHGFPSPSGCAVVLKFNSVETLNQHLSVFLKTINATLYEIVAVEFEQVAKKNFESYIRKIKRSHIPDSKKEEIRQKDRYNHQQKRSELKEEMKRNIKENNTTSRRTKRSQLDEQTRMNICATETENRKRKRSQLDEQTRENVCSTETENRKRKRSQLDEQKKESIKHKDTTSRQSKRSQLDEQKKESIKHKDTTSRQSKRSQLDEQKKESIKHKDTQQADKVSEVNWMNRKRKASSTRTQQADKVSEVNWMNRKRKASSTRTQQADKVSEVNWMNRKRKASSTRTQQADKVSEVTG